MIKISKYILEPIFLVRLILKIYLKKNKRINKNVNNMTKGKSTNFDWVNAALKKNKRKNKNWN